MKTLLIMFILTFSLFADQNKDLEVLSILDSKETALTHFYSKQKPFEKEVFKNSEKIINEILKTPLDQNQTHIDLHKQLMSLYTCRDFILLKQGESSKKIDHEQAMFTGLMFRTKKEQDLYKEHLKIIFNAKLPLPTKEEFEKQKKECIALYKKHYE